MVELKLRTRSVNYGRDFDALRHAKRLTYRSASGPATFALGHTRLLRLSIGREAPSRMTTCGTFPDPILSLRSRTASPLQDDSAKSLSSFACLLTTNHRLLHPFYGL